MIQGLFILALIASTQALDCSLENGHLVNGACWYRTLFLLQGSCTNKCADIGLETDDDQIINFAGSSAADSSGCQAIIDAFGVDASVVDVTGTECQDSGLGCFYKTGETLRCTSPATTSAANANPTGDFQAGGRYCACREPLSSSGGQDPHFHGLNGESLDIVIDSLAANNIFNIYCDEKYVVNALFSPNPQGYLFMTEFYGKFLDVEYHLKLGKYPQLYGDYFGEEEINSNRTRFVIGDGHSIESDEKEMIAKFEDLQININTASDQYDNIYFDIDIIPRGDAPVQRSASGIIGRSFERKYSHEEFAEYYQFKLDPEDDKFTACPSSDL